MKRYEITSKEWERIQKFMEKLSIGASNLLTGDAHVLIDLSSWYKSSLAPKIEMIHDAIKYAS